jgi:chromate transporter
MNTSPEASDHSPTPDDAARPDAPKPVSLAEATAFWCKLGFISFGGPAGQIALMHQELVEKRRWISERRFLHALNYCMVLPGPEAQQLATYIGWLMHRTWGGIVAGVLFVLPSLFILIALSWLYIAYGHLPLVAGLFYGIKPAVVAIVVQAANRIGARTLKSWLLWLIAVAAFVAIAVLNLPFPAIILVAALVGVIAGRVAPQLLKAGGGHGKTAQTTGLAMIDDDTPTPAHARFTGGRLLRVASSGLALWAAPMLLLISSGGWNHVLTRMAWFFTKAALVTFGGAYAVLPYVYQGAVTQFGWLSPEQMIDGLGLGESTPGPLIMVVAFVGFVGGYLNAYLGTQSAFLAGALAALVVTWFTFLPSFVFILAGGPLVEATHNEIKFTSPLTAITAAVVGVIASLALFFGYHVLWSGAPRGHVDWIAATIAVAAGVALIRYKRNVMQVIAACAVAGYVVKSLL